VPRPSPPCRVARRLLACLALTGSVAAQDAADGSELRIGLGGFDVFSSDTSGVLHLQLVTPEIGWGIRPTLGGFAADGGDLYAFLGFQRAFPLPGAFDASLGSAIGLYREGDLDLGGAVEFRSEVQLGYRFSPRVRASLGLAHLSNASLYDHNPGVETLLFSIDYAL